jgi:Aldo/keto reductase family
MSSGIPVAPAAVPSRLPQRLLGQTGSAVTLFGLGGEGVLRTYDRAAEAVRVIHRALEHGVTYCDTAPAYASSLDYYGAALGERPADTYGSNNSPPPLIVTLTPTGCMMLWSK